MNASKTTWAPNVGCDRHNRCASCRFSTRRQTQISAAAGWERRRGSPHSTDAPRAAADVTNQERKSISNASSGEVRALVLQSQEEEMIIMIMIINGGGGHETPEGKKKEREQKAKPCKT